MNADRGDDRPSAEDPACGAVEHVLNSPRKHAPRIAVVTTTPCENRDDYALKGHGFQPCRKESSKNRGFGP